MALSDLSSARRTPPAHSVVYSRSRSWARWIQGGGGYLPIESPRFEFRVKLLRGTVRTMSWIIGMISLEIYEWDKGEMVQFYGQDFGGRDSDSGEDGMGYDEDEDEDEGFGGEGRQFLSEQYVVDSSD